MNRPPPRRRNRASHAGSSASQSSAQFKAAPAFKAPPPRGARVFLDNNEMTPRTRQTFINLLAAGHFIQPGESQHVATTVAFTSTAAPSMSIDLTWLGFIIAVVVILVTIIWMYLRTRKGGAANIEVKTVSTQTEVKLNPDLIFTPHGQCYHLAGCDTVENWRRNVTQMSRRACQYCLGGVLIEPDPERG